jgi:hypothetical protein
LASVLLLGKQSARNQTVASAVGTDNQGNSGFCCVRDYDANGTAFLDRADETFCSLASQQAGIFAASGREVAGSCNERLLRPV